MSTAVSAVVTALASAVRTATQTVTRDSILNPIPLAGAAIPDSTGLVAYLNVTAVPGVDTVLLKLQEQDPVSLAWFDVCSSLAQAATGMIKLKILPGITPAAAAVTGVSVADNLPWNWRLQVVHSAASNFTYSLGVATYD